MSKEEMKVLLKGVAQVQDTMTELGSKLHGLLKGVRDGERQRGDQSVGLRRELEVLRKSIQNHFENLESASTKSDNIETVLSRIESMEKRQIEDQKLLLKSLQDAGSHQLDTLKLQEISKKIEALSKALQGSRAFEKQAEVEELCNKENFGELLLHSIREIKGGQRELKSLIVSQDATQVSLPEPGSKNEGNETRIAHHISSEHKKGLDLFQNMLNSAVKELLEKQKVLLQATSNSDKEDVKRIEGTLTNLSKDLTLRKDDVREIIKNFSKSLMEKEKERQSEQRKMTAKIITGNETIGKICSHVESKQEQLITTVNEVAQVAKSLESKGVKVSHAGTEQLSKTIADAIIIPKWEFTEDESNRLLSTMLKYCAACDIGLGSFFGMLLVLLLATQCNDFSDFFRYT